MSINNGKRKKKKITILGILDVLLILILCLYIIIGTCGLAVLNSMTEDMPEFSVTDLISDESSRIYDADGNLVEEIGIYQRDNVKYDDYPEALVDAFICIEDSRYFKHNGFDIPRFMRSCLSYLQTGDFSGGGGSTLTMQLVKNTYFSMETGSVQTTRSQTLEYKVQQILLSVKAEKYLGKRELFELYVNKMNFGKNIRGVQSASLYYFGKNCSELNLSECAMLAGIVNLPNVYNPYAYLEYGTARRNTVLLMMLNHRYITEEEYSLACSVKLENILAGENYTSGESSPYKSYVDTVISETVELTGMDPTVCGMEIYTALEPVIQSRIEQIQSGYGAIPFTDDDMQVAIVSVDNTNGEIVAIGGGRNYTGSRSFNRATDQYKQPGSAIKPVLSYALAFEYLGYSLDEVITDRPITLPKQGRVLVNAGGTYEGDVTLKDAVAYSLNTPAILALQDVTARIGQDAVIDYLQSLGFSQVTEDNYELLAAIGGNAFTTTVTELAGAHAAMINLGVYNKPHTIRKIVTTSGTVFTQDSETQNKRVISSGSAYLADQLMRNNVEAEVGNYMEILQRSYPVYAKTGTTDWGTDGVQYGYPEGAMKDKWMVASTSQYTNVVWCGWDKAEEGKENYFTTEKSSLNIPGNILQLLLDAEALVCPDTLGGVRKPDDVEDVTYVYGTYPHVQQESWMSSDVLVTSQVSSSGLENSPLISYESYQGTPVLNDLHAAAAGNMYYITWYTETRFCSGYSRDISLSTDVVNVNKWGSCLVSNTWLHDSTSYTYNASVYLNDEKIADVTGDKYGFYAGWMPEEEGELKVCGTISTGYGTSNEACAVVRRTDE